MASAKIKAHDESEQWHTLSSLLHSNFSREFLLSNCKHIIRAALRVSRPHPARIFGPCLPNTPGKPTANTAINSKFPAINNKDHKGQGFSDLQTCLKYNSTLVYFFHPWNPVCPPALKEETLHSRRKQESWPPNHSYAIRMITPIHSSSLPFRASTSIWDGWCSMPRAFSVAFSTERPTQAGSGDWLLAAQNAESNVSYVNGCRIKMDKAFGRFYAVLLSSTQWCHRQARLSLVGRLSQRAQAKQDLEIWCNYVRNLQFSLSVASCFQ